MEEKSKMTKKGNGGRGGGQVAVDTEDQKPHRGRMLPVWFFIGLILLVYGVVITATGIYEFNHPPNTILANLHPALWWGGILTVIGLLYVLKYRPRD